MKNFAYIIFGSLLKPNPEGGIINIIHGLPVTNSLDLMGSPIYIEDIKHGNFKEGMPKLYLNEEELKKDLERLNSNPPEAATPDSYWHYSYLILDISKVIENETVKAD